MFSAYREQRTAKLNGIPRKRYTPEPTKNQIKVNKLEITAETNLQKHFMQIFIIFWLEHMARWACSRTRGNWWSRRSGLLGLLKKTVRKFPCIQLTSTDVVRRCSVISVLLTSDSVKCHVLLCCLRLDVASSQEEWEVQRNETLRKTSNNGFRLYLGIPLIEKN